MNILNIKDVELNAGIINSQRLTNDYAYLLATFVFGLLGLGNHSDVVFW